MLATNDIQKIYRTHRNSGNSIFESTISTLLGFGVSIRVLVVVTIALLISLLVLYRLIYINTYNNNFLNKELDSRILRTIKINAMRGSIIDRNGNALAVSTPVSSIWADPTELTGLTLNNVEQIANILAMPISQLNKRLNESGKNFVYLQRAVSPEQAAKIKALHIAGVYSTQEFKRFYPDGELTAHVVGFNNIDDLGSEGIEYAKNNSLVGKNGSMQIIRDRQGDVVDNVGTIHNAVDGATVQLALNEQIQYIAYRALKKAMDKTHPSGASAIVLDAKTGEVLAMLNEPTYNPNNRTHTTLDMLRNRAAINTYEPGSTMKPFIAARAMDDKLVTANTVFNTKAYKIGPKLIRDTHDYPSLTVSQIIEKSSDVGISKIAAKYQPQQLWQYYHTIGFGQKVNTGFPGEARGTLLPWQRWQPLDQASMSYGYAIAVSLMQMARAYTTFTNNGCMLPLTFYKLGANTPLPSCSQIITPQTANTMKTMLAKVTTDGGTASGFATLDNYTSAGKTGTAHKVGEHGYLPNNYVGSFIGFAPVDKPRIIVAIMIDNARKGSYYGASTAGPVFKDIAEPTLRLLGVKPDKRAK